MFDMGYIIKLSINIKIYLLKNPPRQSEATRGLYSYLYSMILYMHRDVVELWLKNKGNNDATTEPLIFWTIEIALFKPGRLTMRSIWVLLCFNFLRRIYRFLAQYYNLYWTWQMNTPPPLDITRGKLK